MIKEISQFIEYLEENNSDIFTENLRLKEGIYTFLEEYDGQLGIKEENILIVGKDTDPNTPLYQDFLERYLSSEMLKNKSLNASEKIYIAIGSPFGISYSGKGYKTGMNKKMDAAKAYFKAAEKHMPSSNDQHTIWHQQLKEYVQTKLFDDVKETYKDFNILNNQVLEYTIVPFYDQKGFTSQISLAKEIKDFDVDKKANISIDDETIHYFDKNGQEKDRKISSILPKPFKDTFMFFFFLKEPKLPDYQAFYEKYLSKKIFLYDLKTNESHGISNDLTVGNITKKPFMRHKTAPFEINYKVDEATAKHLYRFFRLQQKNKILPNPMPLFVDPTEFPLSEKAISFYKDDRKMGHREIIETLLQEKKADLQNYYLIYFQGNLGGSKIIDLDFVPIFRYTTEDMPKVIPIFTDKYHEFYEYRIKNIFEFQSKIANVIFNKQLIQGNRVNYFDDLKINLKFGATATIINLLHQYRKSFYDYIYKSRKQAITSEIFHNIMWHSILDDVQHDEKTEKTKRIKEKLNIWFSFYTYFNHQKKNDMASKIPELWARCKAIANSDEEHLSDNPKEFAFAMGQVIYFLFTKSATSKKTHALLEPFLQKTTAEQLQSAVSNLIATYKHELSFGQGRFERLAREVLAFETNENMKKLQRFILAGYFAKPVIFEKKESKESLQN